MESHRSSVFPELTRSILSRLPLVVHQTAGEAFVFPASGSAMWEAALINTINPGSRLLAPRFGQFSHLFADTARRLGYQVDVIDSQAGDAPDPDSIERMLSSDWTQSIQAVLLVHSETATGVKSDVAAIRNAMDRAGHPALLMVDGVSSIASMDFQFDKWAVDCAITGSQKGYMLPPGLGILHLSEKALARVESCTAPRAYFDLRPMRSQNMQGYFPSTPAVSLLFGLDESLNILLEEGMDRVAARHRRLAGGVRAAIEAWDLRLCARSVEIASDTVSTVMTPDGIDPSSVINHAFVRYDVALAGGLGELAGKAFRIGHLGDMNEATLGGSLTGIEMALLDSGASFRPGAGVGAAIRHWRENDGVSA